METSANVMSQRNRRREREDEYLQNRCNVRRVVNGNTRTDSLRPSGKTTVPADVPGQKAGAMAQCRRVPLEFIVTLA